MTYEDGIGVSFFICIYQLGMLIYYKNSQFEKNLNKLGLRLSYLTLTPTPYENENKPIYIKILKLLIIQIFNFAMIFLSWLFVLYFAFMVVRNFYNKIGMPQAIKDYQWKMRNMDLSIDNIIKLDMAARDISMNNFEEFKANILEDLHNRGFR